MAEYKKGDRVRRTHPDVKVGIGALGTVVRLTPRYVHVDFDNSERDYACWAERLELVEPAAPPPAVPPSLQGIRVTPELIQRQAADFRAQQMAQQQYQQHWTQQLAPDAANLVTREEHAALWADRDNLRTQLGDANGANESLRAQVARLERALDAAQRELARKGGRR